MRRLAIVLVMVLSACATGPAGPIPTTSIPPVATTTPPATTTTVPADETTEALLSPFSEMGPGWSELFFRYGETEEYLGLGVTPQGIAVGPEYGTQTGDGRWWFLDTAKLRIARFDEQGEFLDDYEIPEALLVNGQSFEHRLPQALDNNAIFASGIREVGTAILTVTDEQAYGSFIPVEVAWTSTDGSFIYGEGLGGELYRLAPWDTTFTPIAWLVARDRSRYRVTVDRDVVHIELPDAGVTRTIQMRLAEQPEVVVDVEVQVDTGTDGTLYILVYGAPLTDPELGVGGLFTVEADGTVGRMQSIVNLFSTADPGSRAHLGVTPGTSTPWVMVVGDDGVHVFIRQN